MKKITLIAYCLTTLLMTIVVINNIDPWRPNLEEFASPPQVQKEEDSPQIRFNQAISSIDQENLRTMVYSLALPHGRVTGSNNCEKAANYIDDILKKSVNTMRDPFMFRGKSTENIYGWLTGTTTPNKIIVIGAHYDTVPNSPGADDNASGTAVVLELARAFSKIKQDINHTIVFQLYSAEEYGLHGSDHYCRNPKFPINNPNLNDHIFMMNLDMIGYLGRHTYYHRATSQSPTYLNNLIEDLSRQYPFAQLISFQGGGGSDHASFHRHSRGRIPLIWLFTGTHSHYHRPTDTADRLNYEGMENIAKYAFELIHAVDQGIHTIETKSFNTYEPLCDHDNPDSPFLSN